MSQPCDWMATYPGNPPYAQCQPPHDPSKDKWFADGMEFFTLYNKSSHKQIFCIYFFISICLAPGVASSVSQLVHPLSQQLDGRIAVSWVKTAIVVVKLWYYDVRRPSFLLERCCCAMTTSQLTCHVILSILTVEQCGRFSGENNIKDAWGRWKVGDCQAYAMQ